MLQYLNQARRYPNKVFEHLGTFERNVDDFTAAHVRRVHWEHTLGDVQPNSLLIVDKYNYFFSAQGCIPIHFGLLMGDL